MGSALPSCQSWRVSPHVLLSADVLCHLPASFRLQSAFVYPLTFHYPSCLIPQLKKELLIPRTTEFSLKMKMVPSHHSTTFPYSPMKEIRSSTWLLKYLDGPMPKWRLPLRTP